METTRTIALSILLAEMMKRGEMRRIDAIKVIRTAFGLNLPDALFMIDSAIGNLNAGTLTD